LRAFALLLFSAALCLGPGGSTDETSLPVAQFVQEDVRILAGDGRYTLALHILRPRGSGPFGAVILNHGVPLDPLARQQESAELLLHTASAFAQRGYAVFMPLRRGFGASGGQYAEDPGSCRNPDFRRGEQAAAADVLAAYEYARKRPYVDRERMILAGQSAGGVASVYAAAQQPEGLAAVLAFAAGRGATGRAGVPCSAERLAEVFAELGRAVRAPVLLYYAENDLYFGPETSRRWYSQFKSGGAPAEYVLQPPFGANGHFVFTDKAGVALWLPVVDQFLKRHGIGAGRTGQPA
jgi:dienelactone hydrolase